MTELGYMFDREPRKPVTTEQVQAEQKKPPMTAADFCALHPDSYTAGKVREHLDTAHTEALAMNEAMKAPPPNPGTVAYEYSTPWRVETENGLWAIFAEDVEGVPTTICEGSVDGPEIPAYLVAAVNACAAAGIGLKELQAHGLTMLLKCACRDQRYACVEAMQAEPFCCGTDHNGTIQNTPCPDFTARLTRLRTELGRPSPLPGYGEACDERR